ncbi:Clp protease [Streptomyces spinosirectus]|jgi:ATP-dependent Clp protease ATP-binding subunit ClpC|uniref:Clp protease N-terminal domain-containing protein n=1 Tax=unclassified Streptomyces TaxID=2593676 RepID=UPI000FFF0BF2|nr:MULTISPECIES: Clp protease N-terminal domain-containing protein [Streptomyces]MBY8340960.1 Clp protease [Streptomyces plumbidurans]UIR22427.1 Clp protease [Streptomyces spinosirectus]
MTFERFTAHARKAVVTAQEQARQLKHSHIDTEHVLLGLLDVPDGTAAKVLHRLGYDKETARADIAAVVEPGSRESTGHIPFAPRAKKTLELALREAQQLQHHHVGTEHILLALVREEEGVGAQVLAERINPVSKIRVAVLAAVAGTQDAAAGPWPAGTPATEDTVATAGALAGGAPVGSHHLLEAMLRAENSMAAKVLRELGVDPDAVAAKIDELDPETTTDANPEEAAARRMEIRVVDDEVHLILRDPETVTVAKNVTELSNGPIQGVGPVAGLFVPLWRSTNQLLLQIQGMLEPEPEEDDASAAGRVAKAVRTVLAPRLRR